MNRQDEADYTALKEYLCDMILEEQLKLGYERETIRFIHHRRQSDMC